MTHPTKDELDAEIEYRANFRRDDVTATQTILTIVLTIAMILIIIFA